MRPILLLMTMAAVAAAELPVKHVVLYKHGVGYFERAGEVRPGETGKLEFREADMDDVLKSLVVEDRAGGVARIRYDSSEPLARRLAAFPFQIGERTAVSAFLDSLKGARIEVRYGSSSVTGAIVSGRVKPAAGEHPETETLTLLLDSGDLQTLDLSGTTNLRLTDPELQSQLKDYLGALRGARSREKRTVYIDSRGSGSRQIAARYVLPVPVWKSSYRLVFGDSGEPLLEGWAIVDNVTGEDWTDVGVSLVSGRPISFISRLYEPRYVTRPTAELPEDRPQAPAVHGGVIAGVGGGIPAERGEEVAAMRARQFRDLGLRKSLAEMPAAAPAEIASSIAVQPQARELGELFEYQFPSTVTIRKGESAMLPFIQQKIAARKLLIYADAASQHPMNAAELTNNTGKTLDGGPVTVFDGGAYGGEALMETLKASDKRLISYAIDLGTRVTTAFDSGREAIREARFQRGILTVRQAIQETRTYTIRNADQKAKTLILEHSARPEFKLVGAKPLETTASAYRFEVKLPPGGTEKFPVIEERTYENSVAVVNLTPDVLGAYAANKALSEQARKQLEQIATQKRLLAEADRSIAGAEREFADLSQDQERLRQNIASLNRVSAQQEQVQNYARQLAAQEAKLAALRDRIAELRKKKATLESELNALVERIEF